MLVVDGIVQSRLGAGLGLVVASATAPIEVKRGTRYVCDGTADDVDNQSALDALPHSGEVQGGLVRATEGQYNTVTAILLNKYGNRLEGVGEEATYYELASGGPVIKIGDGSVESDNGKNQEIGHLKVGANTDPLTLTAIELDKVQRTLIHDVVIRWCAVGLQMEDFQWVDIRRLTIRNGKQKGISMVASLNSDGHVSVDGCNISMDNDAVNNDRMALELSGTVGAYEVIVRRSHFLVEPNGTGNRCVNIIASGANVHLVFDTCTFEVIGGSEADVVGVYCSNNNALGSLTLRDCTWFGGGKMLKGVECTGANFPVTLWNPTFYTFTPTTGHALDVAGTAWVHNMKKVDVDGADVGTIKSFVTA